MIWAEWQEKYEIVKVLSSKQDTKVYLVEHKRLKAMRIMKQIFKESVYFKELSKEIFLMKDLKHFGIPQIYDIEEDDESICVIEQYINGESLKFICSKENLKESDMLNYMIQICDIIEYLHSLKRPVLYLDLKPENVIILENKAFLVDFGSAVYADMSEKSLIFGTKGFAAPEQYGRKQAVDERSDIYAIGKLLYYMASGDKTCREDYSLLKKPEKLPAGGNISKGLKNIISSCIRHNSWMRYAKVEEVKRNMEKIYYNKPLNTYNQKSIIAVAGSQHRIGTTHLALMLCRRYSRISKEVLYLENNPTGFLREYLFYSNIILKPGINKLNEFHAGIKEKYMPLLSAKEEDISKYNYAIWDFGVLNEMNIDEFLSMENKVVVLGGKEWEISESRKAAGMCFKKQGICYVINFLEAGRMADVAGIINKGRCIRMPYIPEPINGSRDNTAIAFVDDILRYFNLQGDSSFFKHRRKRRSI